MLRFSKYFSLLSWDGTPQISNEEQIRFTANAIGDFTEDLN